MTDSSTLEAKDAAIIELSSQIATLEARLLDTAAVIEAARRLERAPVCERGYMSFGHETCTPSGAGCDLHHRHMLKHALFMLADGKFRETRYSAWYQWFQYSNDGHGVGPDTDLKEAFRAGWDLAIAEMNKPQRPIGPQR